MHRMRGEAFVSCLDLMALNKFTIKFQEKEKTLLAKNNVPGMQLREMLLSKKQGIFFEKESAIKVVEDAIDETVVNGRCY